MIRLIPRHIDSNRKILYYAILAYMIYGFSDTIFGVPYFFSMVVEFFALIMWFRPSFQISKCRLKYPFIIFILLIITVSVGALLNMVNPINFIMGFRSQFMPIVLFFAAASFLKIQDYVNIFRLMYKFQYLNLFCTLVQFFIYGYTSDLNNGALSGGGQQNIFCAALLTYYFFAFSVKKENIKNFLFVVISSILIAIIQDEKFIFIAFGINATYFVLSKKINTKNIITSAIIIASLFIGINNLSEGQKQSFGSVENISNYAQKAGTGYGLPRIGSAPIVSEILFDTPIKETFGVGLGTATESKSLFVDSTFFEEYGWLTYYLFTFQNVFVNTGWSGIILFVGFFISLFIYNYKCKKKVPKNYKWIYDVAMTFCLISIVIIWYGNALRVYCAVLPYIILGIGASTTRELISTKNNNNIK